MAIISELLSSKEGLMSLAVLVIMIGMGGYLIRMFIKKMNQDPHK